MTQASGYAGLFLSALLAATVLPASSEAVLVGLLAAGGYDAALLLAVATVGNTLGAAVNWVLGRFLLRFADRRWFPLTPAQYGRAHAWFARYGVWSLLLSWLPVGGDALTVVAGALRVDFRLFLVLVAAGKGARYVALAAGARWAGLG